MSIRKGFFIGIGLGILLGIGTFLLLPKPDCFIMAPGVTIIFFIVNAAFYYLAKWEQRDRARSDGPVK